MLPHPFLRHTACQIMNKHGRRRWRFDCHHVRCFCFCHRHFMVTTEHFMTKQLRRRLWLWLWWLYDFAFIVRMLLFRGQMQTDGLRARSDITTTSVTLYGRGRRRHYRRKMQMRLAWERGSVGACDKNPVSVENVVVVEMIMKTVDDAQSRRQLQQQRYRCKYLCVNYDRCYWRSSFSTNRFSCSIRSDSTTIFTISSSRQITTGLV